MLGFVRLLVNSALVTTISVGIGLSSYEISLDLGLETLKCWSWS